MSFVLYRSPPLPPGAAGEPLGTPHVAEAWARIRRFLADCTDDPSPHAAVLRVDQAVDDDGGVAAIVDAIAVSLGAGTLVTSSSGDERGWEWSVDPTSPTAVAEIVTLCARYEGLPRIHVNPAVRGHGSPKTPQVWAILRYEIALRGPPDLHAYPPGWGQSRFVATLGHNDVSLVLHLPFADVGPALFEMLDGIERALQITLDRERLLRYGPATAPVV